jgi:hypothetical protein
MASVLSIQNISDSGPTVIISYVEMKKNIVMDLLQALLGNGWVNTVNVQQWWMPLSGRMLLRVAR